jgi:hypothetical protein
MAGKMLCVSECSKLRLQMPLRSVQESGSQRCFVRWLCLQVPLKLVDDEIRQLLLEFPDHTQRLQRLEDVTARARK